jgi:DNA-binding HxlR family transcriptional regulator
VHNDEVALPREYPAESCPVARSLEIVGERWTLLIVRDAFHGVRRFSDFRAHLDIPKAVLAERLARLVDEGVLTKTANDYELSGKGRTLWPIIWSLIDWGNQNYVQKAARRSYRHADCGGAIDQDRSCRRCGQLPEAADLVLHPPRQPRTPGRPLVKDDPISVALRRPHRLLEPL